MDGRLPIPILFLPLFSYCVSTKEEKSVSLSPHPNRSLRRQ
jgi:hypothetical protein